MFQGPSTGDRDRFWAIPYSTHVEGRLGTNDGVDREVVANDLYFSFAYGGDWDAPH